MRANLVAAALLLTGACGGRETGDGTAATTASTQTTSATASSGSSTSGGCGADENLCAMSCDPPVYQCQPSGFGCRGCPPEDDAGDIEDASQVEVTSDGAVCSPGMVACPIHWCTTDPTTACLAANLCIAPPCPPPPPDETSDGAICTGPGVIICSDLGVTYCTTGPYCPPPK